MAMMSVLQPLRFDGGPGDEETKKKLQGRKYDSNYVKLFLYFVVISFVEITIILVTSVAGGQ